MRDDDVLSSFRICARWLCVHGGLVGYSGARVPARPPDARLCSMGLLSVVRWARPRSSCVTGGARSCDLSPNAIMANVSDHILTKDD